MMNIPILESTSLYADNLAYWENFLTDEQLSYLNTLADKANTTGAVGVANLNLREDKNIRSALVSWMYSDAENTEIWESVSRAISVVNASFFGYDIRGFYEPAQLTRYPANINGHYTWHTDSHPKQKSQPRKLTGVILLNDPSEFKGGDLCVRLEHDNPDPVEQKRGRMWVFPSWAFHRVTPVTFGVRKTIVFWAGGPSFK